jgi:hypothetical protein
MMSDLSKEIQEMDYDEKDKEADLLACESWTMTHSFYANMGGFVLVVKNDHVCRDPTQVALPRRRFPVNSGQIQELVKRRLINMPQISETEIKDKSKGDNFTQGVASWQITWLVVQCCVRKARYLPLSQL